MAQYAVGSFTKNFGWDTDPPGLNKLHRAIRAGFSATPEPVERSKFRTNSGIVDPGRQLVAVNFFLHNSILGGRNFVSVDELVRQALIQPHSRPFDHLAVFALHLSRLGRRTGVAGHANEAGFLNDYVRNHLWSAGGWRKAATDAAAIQSVFEASLIAEGPDTAHKCVTNYRFILQQAGYTEGRTDVINSRADDWATPALFLAFDRYSLDSGVRAPRAAELVQMSESAELFKLLGIPSEGFRSVAVDIARLYLEVGGLERPLDSGVAPSAPSPEPKKAQRRARRNATATWTNEGDLDATQVTRRLRQLLQQQRNPKNAHELKALYDHECCFCGRAIVVGVSPDRHYSEAAHIRALGQPHNGPDQKSNMLILCPEHHLQFDSGILRIVHRGGQFIVLSKVKGDPLHNAVLRLRAPHTIDAACAAYHAEFWLDR